MADAPFGSVPLEQQLKRAKRALDDATTEIALLRKQAEERERRFAELLRVVGHVKAEETARREAEASAHAAWAEAKQTCAEREQRYADLFHLVDQVDAEIKARRAAEQQREETEEAAHAAILRVNEERDEAEERTKALEVELLPLRERVGAVELLAAERQEAIETLQEQLDDALRISESRKLAYERASKNAHSAEAELEVVRKDINVHAERAAELEVERDNLLRRLKHQKAVYAELADRHGFATSELDEKRKDTLNQKHVIKEQQQTVQELRADIQSLQSSLAQIQIDVDAWRERADVIGQAICMFLRKFPAPAALATMVKHCVSVCAGTNARVAIRRKLYQKGGMTPREMAQFLEQTIGLAGPDNEIVVSAFFAAIDVEREGLINETRLLERFENPPSMKQLWLADFAQTWPEQSETLAFFRSAGTRSPSPPCRRTPSTSAGSPNSRPHSSLCAPVESPDTRSESSAAVGKRRTMLMQRPGSSPSEQSQPVAPPSSRPLSATSSRLRRSRVRQLPAEARGHKFPPPIEIGNGSRDWVYQQLANA